MKKIRVVGFVVLITIDLLLGYILGDIIIKKVDPDKDATTNLHFSYFSDKSFSDKAYRDIGNDLVSGNNIRGIIVNHHLLATNLIAKTINNIATTSQVTVVLISPNHFSSGRGQILSSLYDWNTPYGILESDKPAILNLKEKGAINIDEYPFEKEHGISGIVPFIKKSIPNSRIVPIIIKDNLSKKELDGFVDSLYDVFWDKTLIVGSFDFSHYYPDNITQLYDKKSISIITNFNFDNINDVEVDSKPGLEIVMRYMQKVGAIHFNLIANTNSSQILRDPNIKEVVSYINGFFAKN
ncbi:MAG: AmmeMemoRadiSam system protein B [bacterium]